MAASFGGGLASGLEGGMRLNQQRAQRQQRERDAQLQQLQQLSGDTRTRIQDTMETATEFLQSADESGISRNDPRVVQGLQTFLRSAVQTAQKAREAGVPNVPDPEMIMSRMRSQLSVQATPEAAARTEAGASLAAAETVAEGTGASQREAAEGQGLLPSRPNLQTKTAIRVEDGEIQDVQRAVFDPQSGETRLENGDPLPEGYITSNVDIADTAEGVQDLSPTERRTLNDQQVAAANFVSTAQDALELVQQYPDINTFTANIAAFTNDLQQEAKAMARSAGFEFDESVLDPAQYEQTFDDLGIQNERMKSLFVSLSFQAAMASGQSGKSVSDRDVERFLRNVGAQSSDPRALSQVLTDLAQRTVRNFKNSHQVRTGQPFDGDLGLSELPSLDGASEPSGGEQTLRFQRDDSGNLVPVQ